MVRSCMRLLLVALAALPATCLGQLGRFEARSLEWLVADADVVVRATVARVDRVAIPPANPRFSENPRVREVVALKVIEVIKGDPAAAVEFGRENFAEEHIAEGWRDAGREALWFLKRAAGPTSAASAPRSVLLVESWPALRLGPPVLQERGWVSRYPPIFLMDLSVVAEPAAILVAARGAARAEARPGPSRAHEVELPRLVMQRTGTSGDINSLAVPADSRLAALARRWVVAPADFIRPGESIGSDWLRLEGIKAQHDFRSDEAITLLKTLLDDPTIVRFGNPDGTTVPIYVVRRAAFEMLREWGVAIAEPVLRADSPGK